MFRSLITIVFATLWLTGCTGMRLVDTDVRSYVSPPGVPVGAYYRFERLPSQLADAVQQTRLEAMAQQALSQVGLQRNEEAASYSVQISASMKVDPYGPWDQPSNGWGMGWSLGFGLRNDHALLAGNRGFMPGFDRGDLPYYWRQISLIIRNLKSAQVVYETHAAHDGRWADSEAVLPAMLEAALKDFPNPPPGVRRINLEIAR